MRHLGVGCGIDIVVEGLFCDTINRVNVSAPNLSVRQSGFGIFVVNCIYLSNTARVRTSF
nr:MAG TPA: hypothetical protein [Caudoviricetes sp.]